jgi:cytochrome c oxidase subunit IV
MADAKSHASHDDHGHGHGHADDGMVHSHISSVKFYVLILAGLMILTLLTVGVASIHLGKLNLAVAVIISSMKATLVVMFFMHLKYDNKFNATILVCSLLFIGIFFAYTLNDTDRRGELDDAQGSQVLPSTGVVAPGGMEGIISPERSHENIQLPSSEDMDDPMQKQAPVVNRSPSEMPGMAAGGLGGTGESHEHEEGHGAAHEGAPAGGEHAAPPVDQHK